MTTKMPAYVNMSHFTFVCTKCSGIHRELQYKIKGISVSAFTQEDVDALEAGGNASFNSVFLARYNSARDIQLPTNASDISKLRDFIRMKYSDKKWHTDSIDCVGSSRRESGGNAFDGGSFTDSPAVQSSAASRRASVQETGRAAGVSKEKDSNRRASISIAPLSAPKQVAQAGDLLDLMNSSPSVPQSNGFAAFSSTGTSNAPQPVTFNAFDSTSPASFDPFSNSVSSVAAPFDPFSGTNSSFSQSVSAPPQILQVPFLQVTPPKEPEPAPVALPESTAQNVRRSFSAFDEIAPVAPTVSGNPFDAPSPNTSAPIIHQQQYGQLPQAIPGPFGYPPHTGFIPSQAGYPGMPPQQGYPYSAPTTSTGYPYGPPQASYAPQHVPPHGHPNPYGYPNLSASPPPPPQQQQPNIAVHGQVIQSGNPFSSAPQTSSGSYYPQQQQAQLQLISGHPHAASTTPAAPTAPVAPDPFAAMGGTAWSSVGGKPKPSQAQSFGTDIFCDPEASAQNMQQPTLTTQFQPANPFSSTPEVSNLAPTIVNPFDLF